MSAAQTVGVDSVVARCMLDAEFLDAVCTDPVRALAPYEIDDRARSDLHALDFTRVRNFAGFVTKVQHNYLWEQLPYTRALIKRYGIEIDVFAAYHGRHLELRASGASRADKIGSFLDFLDSHVSRDEHPGLHDIALHERIEWELESARPEGDVPEARIAPGPLGELVPHVRGSLRVARFESSPLAIVDQLAQGGFDAAELVPAPGPRVYWADPIAERLRILEIDDLTAALLGAADGSTPVRAILAQLAGEGAVDEALTRVMPIFEAVVELGVLTLLAPEVRG